MNPHPPTGGGPRPRDLRARLYATARLEPISGASGPRPAQAQGGGDGEPLPFSQQRGGGFNSQRPKAWGGLRKRHAPQRHVPAPGAPPGQHPTLVEANRPSKGKPELEDPKALMAPARKKQRPPRAAALDPSGSRFSLGDLEDADLSEGELIRLRERALVDDTGELAVGRVIDEDDEAARRRRRRRGGGARERQLPPHKDPFMFIEAVRRNPASLEFVYLVTVEDDPSIYNPYRLEIVDHSEIRPEDYYTMSASGVTHFMDGVAEFTPLDQWEREYHLFKQIMSISLFRKYRIWKAYSVWRRNVRGKKMRTCREKINNTLFILNPIIRSSLLQLRDFSQRVKQFKLFEVEPKETYTLDAFVEAQEAKRNVVLNELSRYSDDVREAVRNACELVLNGVAGDNNAAASAHVAALLEAAEATDGSNNNNNNGNGTLSNNAMITVTGGGAGGDANNAGAGAPPKMSYTDMAARRSECRRLTSYIRLADYLVIETLHGLAMDSIHSLLRHLLYARDEAAEKRALAEKAKREKAEAAEAEAASQAANPRAPRGPEAAAAEAAARNAEEEARKKKESQQQRLALLEEEDDGGHLGGPDDPLGRRGSSEYESSDGGDRMSDGSLGSRGSSDDSDLDSDENDSENDSENNAGTDDNNNNNNNNDIDGDLRSDGSGSGGGGGRRRRRKRRKRRSRTQLALRATRRAKLEARAAFEATLEVIEAEYGPVDLAHRATSLFELEMQFVADELSFSPSTIDFQRATDALLADFIRTVDSVDRLLKHDDFKDYTAPSSGNGRVEVADAGEGPDLASMILVDTKYQRLVTAINQSLSRTFLDVEEYAFVFLPFKRMFTENRTVTLDFLRMRTDLHRLRWFKSAMDRYEKQRGDIEALEPEATIGIVTIRNETLKSTFLPSPQSCLDAIHTLLPELARKRNESLLAEIRDAIARLENECETVPEFVDYLDFLEEINERLEGMQREYQMVTEMYALMDTYSVAVAAEETALFQTLPPSFARLKGTIAVAESGRERNVAKFAALLESNIADMNAEVHETREQAQDPSIGDLNADIDATFALTDALHERMAGYKARAKDYSRYQEIFQVEISRYDELEEAAHDAHLKRLLWDSLRRWRDMSEAWNASQFQSIDADEISSQVQRFSKSIHQLQKGLEANPVVPRLKELVDQFKLTLPVVLDLRNPSLKSRHWLKIEETIGQKLTRDDRFTLGLLMEMKVMDHKDAIAAVSLEATNEAVLEETLKKVEAVWARTEFAVLPHKDYKDVFIVGGVDDIILQLEDSRMTVSTVKSSRYVGAIQQEVDDWDRNLALFAETLDEWITCQRNWMYLESIFSAADIQRQLPAEAKMFQSVDKAWRDFMRKTRDNPNALRCATGKGILEMFRTCNVQLDKIQKCLEDYLETKRMAFPRFFFLSNDELLEILAQTKNPHAVQPHLRKCFDSMKRLEFGDEPKSIEIMAMVSAEGERVQLGKNLKARGNVEAWLGAVEESMVKSLKRATKAAVLEYERGVEREDFVLSHPAQVVSTVTQIFWCRDVTHALGAANPVAQLRDLVHKCRGQITGLVGLIRGELTPLQRGTLEALITLDVHSRDIVEELARDQVDSVLDYGWSSRLRYYWESDADDCIVRQTNASFNYGYEYLGCTTRLVVTPLTDRCYLTLTGALHLQLGGSPAGPAGTGKTETVKDLAKALARQCVVFNCSDGLDYKMMGRFFSGLAMCGAWCCFDEFNRIDIEVLSVIAQQLLTIRNALSAKATKFFFEGREIGIKPQIGYFVTMNPGYAGRTELPDNLKALFRPVSMMIPDYALIAEIILFGAGFESAAVLSRKMVMLYKLASEQLSQQDHYDFGMRAVKSVLVMAGALKRANLSMPEDIVLIRALRDSNVPKFLAEDVPLFMGILSDLFPGVTLPQHDYGELQAAIEGSIRARELQVVPKFVTKTIQLFETMEVRHGVMLVGPTGAGKTRCYQVLQDALTHLRVSLDSPDQRYQAVHTYVLNPKCVSMGELYGEFNDITLEWTDGLVASIVREIVVDESEDAKWVVFDGPVDALWIENMNTVLDDNKTLCLANSERIKLNDTMHMVFEVQDLAVASPATVSRCGMVYMEPVDLGWRPYVRTWLGSLPGRPSQDVVNHIVDGQFGTFVDQGLAFVRSRCKEDIPSTDLNLVSSLCSLYYALLMEHAKLTVVERYEAAERRTRAKAGSRKPALKKKKGGGGGGGEDGGGDHHQNGAGGGVGGDDGGADDDAAAGHDDDHDHDDDEDDDEEHEEEDIQAAAERAVQAKAEAEAAAQMHLDPAARAAAQAALAEAQRRDEEKRVVDLAVTADDEAAFAATRQQLDQMFAFAYVWSIGGNIESESRLEFDTFFRDTTSAMTVFPGAGTVYDYFIDFVSGGYEEWSEVVPAFRYDRDLEYNKIVVPTVETVRSSYLLKLLVRTEKSVLFNGGTGVGKSVIAGTGLREMQDADGVVSFSIIFSAQTSSRRTQEIIESKTEKKRKTIRGAPAGKKLALFVDDLNMPKLDTYGAQPPIELLRQYLDFGGFYDRKKLFWTAYEDLTLVAACAPPGGGRNPTTARLLRHFNMIYLPPPSQQSLKQIFGAIVGGFLQPFNPKVQALGPAVVDASVEVYTRIATELLPTPAKSHYTFNLRDLSKVFQGVLMCRPATVSSPELMMKLWCHESMRVFSDRLINDEDKRWFTEFLVELLRRHFAASWTHEELFEGEPIMFGDWLHIGVDASERKYELVPSMQRATRLLEDYLDEYNLSSNKEMRLVFFRDAIEHVSRIVRIIRQPSGNALLVGVGGSGKQSLTRLACTMAEYKCFQLELTKGYGMAEFREDIKKLYWTAAVERQPVVFLLSDTQIVQENFLEDINNLLNTGEIPNLFEPDEYEKLLGEVRVFARELGYADSRDAVHACMIGFVRSNLHVVLCMSPVGDNFRRRCRLFPSLVNCCTIDWFSEWPESALLSVSRRFLSEGIDVGGKEAAETLAQMCVYVHTSVIEASDRYYNELRRRNYTTPTSYLELINLYLTMLEERRGKAEGSRDKLRFGIQKLVDTNDSVAQMQVELVELQPVLQQKSEETETLLGEVAREQEIADGVRKVVMSEEKVVAKQTQETQALADDAQADLDVALPVLEQAVAALNSLNKNDVSEMKSFTNPPPLVQLVMEAVCILCRVKPDWASAKSLLSDVNFLKNLVAFDKDNIEPSTLKKLKKYIDDPQFMPDTVAKVSTAAKSLCMWCRAIENYSNVAKVVAPKRARLNEARSALEASQAVLAEKQGKLAAVEEQLANLRATYENALSEKMTLSERLDDTSKRIQRATKLTSALGDEQVRWGETADAIELTLPNLIGDVFLSAASIAYLGPFTAQYRKELTAGWHARIRGLTVSASGHVVDGPGGVPTDDGGGDPSAADPESAGGGDLALLPELAPVPTSEDYTLVGNLGEPVQVRDWNICGLPSDALSTENGIMVTRGRRWPLMIDPQGQANHWIKNLEARNQLKVVRLSESNYLRVLENCIRVGQPVLMEHVGETLDPSLEPVLLKQTFKLQGRTVIRLGDADVDYDPEFRFYITTKLANPHYLPETCIKVTVINFTVTLDGLREQLLGDVVRNERPDLEEDKDRLVVSMASDKKLLSELEDRILQLINASEGNILDDEVLINTLNESKVTSGIIKTRVAEAEKTEVEINEARGVYLPVAMRGAILYFAVADLANVDPMYQFSLAYFKKLFNRNLEVSARSDSIEERLEIILATSTETIYRNACRGLFEKDKLIFAFTICVQIMREAGEITAAEWNYLIRGNLSVNRDTQPANPDPSWVSPAVWDLVTGLPRVAEAFRGFSDAFPNMLEVWRQYAESPEIATERVPGKWHERLTPFQRLLLVRVLSEEQLVYAVQRFVSENLGDSYTRPPPFDLDSAFEDSSSTSPLIFVLSQGADPTETLLRFSRSRDYADRLKTLSLGQGQGPIAARMIAKAMAKGDWVLLQNCHLAKSWMPQLEKIVESFESDPDVTVHDDFRLWLTSMPTRDFPVAVLQNGLKMTVEAPKGVRTNVLRTLNTIREEDWDGVPEKPKEWHRLVFALAFFHAIVQERRKFGALGWNIRYEFSDSDFDFGFRVLKMYLLEQETVPFHALRQLTGHVNYGGRVTDDIDRRCLMTILGGYYTPAALSDGYKLSESGTYAIPTSDSLEEVKRYVENLPANEAPEVFGMGPNASIAHDAGETKRLLDTILSVQPREVPAADAVSPEDHVMEKARSMLEHLPKPLSMDDATVTPSGGRSRPVVEGNSLSVVLAQEIARFNRLLAVLRRSLTDVMKGIRGLVVMSAELESVFNAMLDGRVPEVWATAAYPSLKPLGSWAQDLGSRVAFFNSWLTEGQPHAFWLPAFFFPQGFLTGALQMHARKTLIPIDNLGFTFEVLRETGKTLSATQQHALAGTLFDPVKHGCTELLQAPPDNGIYIYGVFIDSGRWDAKSGSLVDAAPRRMYERLPTLHFGITSLTEGTAGADKKQKVYEAPLYKEALRKGVLSTTGRSSNYVLSVSLKTDREPEHFIRRGTALLLALSD